MSARAAFRVHVGVGLHPLPETHDINGSGPQASLREFVHVEALSVSSCDVWNVCGFLGRIYVGVGGETRVLHIKYSLLYSCE